MHVCMQYLSSELIAARAATTGRPWENLPLNAVPLIIIMTLNCRSMELAALGARAKSQWVVLSNPDAELMVKYQDSNVKISQTGNITATPVETTGTPPLGLLASMHICSRRRLRAILLMLLISSI